MHNQPYKSHSSNVFNFSQEISDISFKEKENLLLNKAFINLLKKCEMFVNVSDEKLEVIFFSVAWFFKLMQFLVQTTNILKFF